MVESAFASALAGIPKGQVKSGAVRDNRAVTDALNTDRRPGPSELIRELGLLVDGPAQWSRPVPSRAPGIFVVELPSALADAPIDITSIRRWLERVPELTLDGERPTPQALAKRLHEFWLASEPVLYVGRSAKQIGARVAAMYATPLGDARPHSGGHWLRTLSVLPELRIWWAETDAHEEYEDALLTEIEARNAGSGRDAATGRLLPFANLMTPDGVAKASGLLNSLRTEVAAAPSTPARRSSSRSSSAAGGRTTSTPARPRKPAPVKDAPARPQAVPTFVSREGMEQLGVELEDLKSMVRPQVIARVKAARELGDLRENADYDYARKEQSFVEGRIQSLEQMLRTGVVIERDETMDSVHLGSTVDIESEGERVTYEIVGSTEAKPSAGRLSNASPVGRALLGARAGETVVVDLPGGSIRYRVIEVR